MTESEPTVSLREITKANLFDILRLKVAPHQEQFVASNAVSLAEAHFEARLPWYRGIYAGDTPVGFLMLEYDEEHDSHNLWRFMIEAQHQGRGYGKEALELLFAHVKTLPGTGEIYVHCMSGEGGPGPFYEGMGFVCTDEEEGGGVWMRRLV